MWTEKSPWPTVCKLSLNCILLITHICSQQIKPAIATQVAMLTVFRYQLNSYSLFLLNMFSLKILTAG